VFLLAPSWDQLEKRLRGRRTDAPEAVEHRLATARTELARQDEFDLRVVNDDSRRAADEIVKALS
jgi:guanylate kinase